ncbi:MAG: Crp/Fnr family transcriptional regulator [Phyllobacteriaceae bacterium]|nr:Crp/Fnr family transcriptional regulator [Phyllobacteriaceae bacterium]
MPPRFSISGILTGPTGEEFFKGFVGRSYAKGSLVATGDIDENGILVVMSGRLRMFLIGEDRELSLFYLGPGDMFCMHSGCLVEAIEPSELRITDIATFDRKLRENPLIAWALISILGRALASFLHTIEDLMFHDIKQRIARFFVEQATAGGHGFVDGTEIRLGVEEIAKSVGSSRQATSTAMNCMIKEGLITRLRRGSYSIPSLERLRGLR